MDSPEISLYLSVLLKWTSRYRAGIPKLFEVGIFK